MLIFTGGPERVSARSLMFGWNKEPVMDSAVETVVTELASTNTARPLTQLAAELRNVWQTVSRSLSDENRALIQHASQVRRTLFPVQTAIFDTLAHIGETSMQGTDGPHPQRLTFDLDNWRYGEPVQPPVNVDDVRLAAREHPQGPFNSDDFRQIQMQMLRQLSQQEGPRYNLGPEGSGWRDGREQAAESTADSWRTQMSVDDVSGEHGWLEEAKKEVDEKYGVASDTGMPDNVANLKESLRRAKKACNEEERRVSHLSMMALGARNNIDKTNKILLTIGEATDDVDAPAKAVMAALTELATTADTKGQEAVLQLTKHKRALYVLQQAWNSMIGGDGSLVPLCCICLTEGVDTACTPCGHTFCHGCATACRSRGKCPNCRAVVRSQHKLFFA